MRSTPLTPACALRRRRSMLVVGGFTVPAIMLGSILGSTAAIAAPATTTPTDKSGLTNAFGAATGVDSTYQLTGDLAGPSDDGTSDVQTLAGGKSLTIDLGGKDLDLDQLRVGTNATLTVIDSVGHGSLVVGASVLSAGDATGVKLAGGAHLVLTHGADVTAVGSTGLPGVGTTGSGTGTTVEVSDGASLTATGSTGSAGIGGGAALDVTVDDATVSATGGTGAAGIGGSSGTGGSDVTLAHGADVTARDGAASGSPTAPASAIGNGQGSTDGGSLTIDGTSDLTVPAGATLRVPSGTTFASSGTIHATGTLTGAGEIANHGAIIPATGSSVDADLNVTDHDYAVTLDAGTGGSVSPTSKRVLASSFDAGSVTLPTATADSAHHFLDWRGGTPAAAVDATTDLATIAGAAGANGAKAVTLAARYGTLLSFSQGTDLGRFTTTTAVTTRLTVDGTGPTAFSQPTAGALPAGVTLASDGTLSGTPTTAGAFTFTVDVTGPYSQSVSRTYTGSVGVVPVLAAGALGNAVVGSSYHDSIAATAGSDGTTYSAPAGSLPAGLSLASDGTITGTPTAAAGGTTTFTVTATNAYGSDHAAYTILTRTIPVFTTTTLPAAVLGQAYSKQLATTGDGSITYALSPSTPLPGQMTLSSSGLISGTATRSGSRTITVVATSQYGSTSQDYVFVAGNVPAITTASLPGATVGDSDYSVQLTTTGDGPITWSATGLPAGLHLSSTGLLTGPIAAAGSTTFTVTSTSSFGTVEKDLTITAGAKPSITTSSISDPVAGHAFHATVAATGTGSATFTATGLPAGLSIDAGTGEISGTPTAAGAATVHVTATSVWGADTATYTVTVHLQPAWATSAVLPDAAIGADVDQHLSAPGDGSTTYTSTDLPGTLDLTAAGHLTGHVTSATTGFTVTATNAYGSVDRTFSIAAGAAPHITTTAGDLAAPVLGDSGYSATVAASGDGSPTFAVTSGDLPAGLQLDGTTGAITGTPTAPGQATFTVTAHSHWGDDAKSFTLVVGVAPFIVTQGLAAPTLGGQYDQPVVALTSGTGVTYAVTSGALPHGLSLDGATGHIAGTVASDAVASTFTVTVHTTYGDAHRAYTLTPGTAAHITTSSLDAAVTGDAFTGTIAASGDGVTYAVTAGSLPDGLHLAADGTITGTPTAAGTAHFTVTASSAYGDDHATYDLTVAAAPSFTTEALPTAVAGFPWSQVIRTAGTGSVALHVQGALPAGLAFDAATGVLSGTPTATGRSTVTIVAVSSLATRSHAYAFTVVAAPALATAALPKGTAGTAYSTAVRATGDGDVTYAVTAGALPAGLTLNARTGALAGTPSAAGTATFTVTASSAYGTDSRQLSLTVDAAPVAAPAPKSPVMPVLPKATAEYGHPFALSVAADSTVPVIYAVRGNLPKGVTLNRATGVVSGTPTQAGSFTFTVSATGSAGSNERAYTVVVPAIQELVTGTANRITPVQGKPFEVSVHGLLKGERWTVTANGRTVATGRAPKAGTVTTEVTLKRGLADKATTIRVSGSRSVTDPAKTASDEFVVTAVTAKKALRLQRSGNLVKVVNLAPHEVVRVVVDGKEAATGRADAKGLYVSTVKAGTHRVVVTGATAKRTGSLTVKIAK